MDNGDIIVQDLAGMQNIRPITINDICNDRNYKDSFVGDIRISDDEKRLFILDQFNFRMVIMDLENEKVLYSIPVGRFPLGIDISHDGKFAYIANTGIFDPKIALAPYDKKFRWELLKESPEIDNEDDFRSSHKV